MLEVDGDDDAALPSTESCRRRRVMVTVFVAFFVVLIRPFYRDLRRTGTKHEISVRKSRENPLEKILSIVISFVVGVVCILLCV
jgi:hypothetical protein